MRKAVDTTGLEIAVKRIRAAGRNPESIFLDLSLSTSPSSVGLPQETSGPTKRNWMTRRTPLIQRFRWRVRAILRRCLRMTGGKDTALPPIG